MAKRRVYLMTTFQGLTCHGAFGEEERAAFVASIEAILHAFEKAMAEERGEGHTSHRDLALRSLGLDGRAVADGHRKSVVTACCCLGSMWQEWRAFRCLLGAVEKMVGEGMRGELLRQLAEAPIQLFTTIADTSGEAWRVRPCFGPLAANETTIQGIGALSPLEDVESEGPYADAGFVLTWSGRRVLLVIHRVEISGSGLSWIAEGFEGLDADTFAACFEREVIYRALNPKDGFNALVAPDVGRRPRREALVYPVPPDEFGKEYRTFFSRRLLNQVRWMATGSSGVMGWLAALHRDEDVERVGRKVEEYYEWAYRANVRLATKKESAVLAETTLEWAHRVFMSDVASSRAYRSDLLTEPVALLLVDEQDLDALDVDRWTSIRDALRQAELLEKPLIAIRLNNAFRQFHTEQRWCRLQGMGEDGVYVGSPLRSAVIRQALVIFDERFKALDIEDLHLKPSISGRLDEGVQAAGYLQRLERLADLYPGELFFQKIKGIGGSALQHVQMRMVELGFAWRYRAVGIDARRFRKVKQPSEDDVRNLVLGLEELGDLFADT